MGAVCPSAGLDAVGGLEPACMRGASPVLIYRACQLVGLLITTSRARRRDKIFVASGIEHVGVALTRSPSGGGARELRRVR